MFSFASPFPAAKDRPFPLVHNAIPIRTADENRFIRISRQHQRCSVRDPCDAQLVTRIGRNSSSCVVERPPALFQDSANSPPKIHLTYLSAILYRGKTARNFLN